uniref:Alternative protein KIAA0240 n=1 Tax=Homo sapiens TaxID=9606 RepID=L8E875_HUMAN|nr:alternative protein KIAA0240 [Homo sapiens]
MDCHFQVASSFLKMNSSLLLFLISLRTNLSTFFRNPCKRPISLNRHWQKRHIWMPV